MDTIVGLVPLVIVALIVLWVAQRVDAKTLGLQYLDALRALGASPATKIVLPMEFTALLRPFVGAGTPGDGGTPR